MTDINIVSPAKINLTLEVGDVRPDGFHNIDSITQTIGITDQLNLSIAPEGHINVFCDFSGVPQGKDNIVFKACVVFFAYVGIRGGVNCEIIKTIPPESGLGGGSSNAAFTIMGLNKLFGCNLDDEKLIEIAASVGSDVPLFISSGTTRMQGRGEVITALPDAPELNLVVIRPSVGVSTAWAYSELDRVGRGVQWSTTSFCVDAINESNKVRMIKSMWNDFDLVVPQALESIQKCKDELEYYGASKAMLSGSGSCVFGVFNDAETADYVADQMSLKYTWVYATRTITRSECMSFVG
ncbi:MAG: 4-(cytidine 5'-diphospho)-2-C-methyl-D-erythritol kinase [Armatimonadota bacterium]